jgi:hypothetical protein
LPGKRQDVLSNEELIKLFPYILDNYNNRRIAPPNSRHASFYNFFPQKIVLNVRKKTLKLTNLAEAYFPA